jgi:hypothetical protein
MTKPPYFIIKLQPIMDHTRETLIFNALKFKRSHQNTGNQDLVDHLLDANPEKADEITRNVCARISLPMSQELEGYASMLGMSKREIITLALSDFFAKAQAVMDEFDAHPKEA